MYKTVDARNIRKGERVQHASGVVRVESVKVVHGIIDLTVRHPRNGIVHLSYRPNERVSIKEG